MSPLTQGLNYRSACDGNRGWYETDFTNTVQLVDPGNPLFGARIWDMSPIEAELGL